MCPWYSKTLARATGLTVLLGLVVPILLCQLCMLLALLTMEVRALRPVTTMAARMMAALGAVADAPVSLLSWLRPELKGPVLTSTLRCIVTDAVGWTLLGLLIGVLLIARELRRRRRGAT